MGDVNSPCNQVLDTITLQELTEITSAIIDALLPGGGIENIYLKSLLVENLKTGIQVIQVCASCAESIPNLEDHLDYCGPDIYGNDRQHSGLLFLPIETDDSTTGTTGRNGDGPSNNIIPGTHKGYILARETRIDLSQSPSLLWLGRDDTNPVVWIYMTLASAQSVVFLLPHFMGYGISTDLYKAYTIRKGYETSGVPLWYQSQTLVKQLSGGCAALGNAAIVAGYSEGGYSSVVLAHALHQNAGVDIIRVHSGGAPYKVSSAAMLGLFQAIKDDTLSSWSLPVLGLLAVSYSSTYPHLANYNSSQHILTTANGTRDVLVEALTGPADAMEVIDLMQNMTQNGTEVLDLLRPAFVAAIDEFVARSISNPCSSTPLETLQQLEMDLLCAALIDNDLTVLLEEQIEFPIEFCHSPDDTLAVVENLPNLDSEWMTQVPDVTGDHFEAAETCFLHIVQTAIQLSTDLMNYPIEQMHDEQQCGVGGGNNTTGVGGGNNTTTGTTTQDATGTLEPTLLSVSPRVLSMEFLLVLSIATIYLL